MTLYGRAVRGFEAGVIAALAVEISFFFLDLIRLEPLVTPAILSGASIGPGGSALDLTNLTGVITGVWAGYQILLLTLAHLVTFAVVGVTASMLFDWSRPTGLGSYALLALLCIAAFFVTVAVSSSMVAVSAVGAVPIVGMNILAAIVMAAALRFASQSPEDATPEEPRA